MARPKTKIALLDLSDFNFNKLMTLIESYSEEEQDKAFPKGTLNRNIRDVLAHLLEWHLMFLEWYKIGMKGGKPEMPAIGHTWKTLPKLNKEIWQKYQAMELKDAKKKFKSSHKRVFKLIQRQEEKELFEKKRYPWTGSTSLAEYLISNSSSHYDWAYKLIKKAKKA